VLLWMKRLTTVKNEYYRTDVERNTFQFWTNVYYRGTGQTVKWLSHGLDKHNFIPGKDREVFLHYHTQNATVYLGPELRPVVQLTTHLHLVLTSTATFISLLVFMSWYSVCGYWYWIMNIGWPDLLLKLHEFTVEFCLISVSLQWQHRDAK
jgi:hypothetical protein